MSRLSKQAVEDALRNIDLPVLDHPQKSKDNGAVGLSQDVDMDGTVEDKQELLTISESQILLLSLRQSRQSTLTSLLPLFPAPQPKSKPRANAKSKNQPPPPPEDSSSSYFPPFLLKPLGPANSVMMKVGPMTFEGVTIWECRFDEGRLKAAGHPALAQQQRQEQQLQQQQQQYKQIQVQGPQRLQTVHVGLPQKGHTMPPPQFMRPPPPPLPTFNPNRPHPAPPRPSIPHPEIIRLVNQSALLHPWLSALIQRAARNLAPQEELRKLGQVVDILGRGKRLAPIEQGEDGKVIPAQIRFVDGPPGSGAVAELMAGGVFGQNMPRPPVVSSVSQGSSAPTTNLPLNPSQQGAQRSSPVLSVSPQPSMQQVQTPPVYRSPPPPPPPPPLPYIAPLLLCSFRENPIEKFVIPIELSYISFSPDLFPDQTSQDLNHFNRTGTMKVSTFLPSKGWGKWTFPESARPQPVSEVPVAPTIVDLTISPKESTTPRNSNSSRKRKRTDKTLLGLPFVSKPFTVGGLTILPGAVQPVNIVFTGMGVKVWESVKGLIDEVEKDRIEEEARIREEEDEDRKAKEMDPGIENIGEQEKDKADLQEERAKRPKRSLLPAAPVEENLGNKATVEGKRISWKAQAFNMLLKRVPNRDFLQYRIAGPVPKEYEVALGDPFAPVYRNIANRLPTEGEDLIEYDLPPPPAKSASAKNNKKGRVDPEVTFELPMSFEDVDQAIAAQEQSSSKVKAKPKPKAKPKAAVVGASQIAGPPANSAVQQQPSSKKYSAPRGVIGKSCEGCGDPNKKVWRKGPNGPMTLCFNCGERYQSGELGEGNLVVTPEVVEVEKTLSDHGGKEGDVKVPAESLMTTGSTTSTPIPAAEMPSGPPATSSTSQPLHPLPAQTAVTSGQPDTTTIGDSRPLIQNLSPKAGQLGPVIEQNGQGAQAPQAQAQAVGVDEEQEKVNTVEHETSVVTHNLPIVT